MRAIRLLDDLSENGFEREAGDFSASADESITKHVFISPPALPEPTTMVVTLLLGCRRDRSIVVLSIASSIVVCGDGDEDEDEDEVDDDDDDDDVTDEAF